MLKSAICTKRHKTPLRVPQTVQEGDKQHTADYIPAENTHASADGADLQKTLAIGATLAVFRVFKSKISVVSDVSGSRC